MRLNEIKDKLELKVITEGSKSDAEVNRGYVSDLMSDVIAHGQEGDIWITYQTHLNVVAIAMMKNMSGVILIQGRDLIPVAKLKAEHGGLAVFSSTDSAFEVVGKLYQLGISG